MRFGLRTMLLGVMAIAIVLAIRRWYEDQQIAAVAAVLQQGGSIATLDGQEYYAGETWTPSAALQCVEVTLQAGHVEELIPSLALISTLRQLNIGETPEFDEHCDAVAISQRLPGIDVKASPSWFPDFQLAINKTNELRARANANEPRFDELWRTLDQMPGRSPKVRSNTVRIGSNSSAAGVAYAELIRIVVPGGLSATGLLVLVRENQIIDFEVMQVNEAAMSLIMPLEDMDGDGQLDGAFAFEEDDVGHYGIRLPLLALRTLPNTKRILFAAFRLSTSGFEQIDLVPWEAVH